MKSGDLVLFDRGVPSLGAPHGIVIRSLDSKLACGSFLVEVLLVGCSRPEYILSHSLRKVNP